MKKRIFCVLLIFVALFSTICFATENNDVMPISEEESNYAIPEEYRRDDIMLISEDLDIQYDEGDTLIYEEESTQISNRNINGNTFVLAMDDIELENITINGNLFVFGAKNIKLTNAYVSGSIFSFAKKIEMINSEVSDIYAISSETISLNGNVAREVKMLSKNIELDCRVDGNVLIYATNVDIKENAILSKKTDINYEESFNQSQDATIENIETNKIQKDEEVVETKEEKIKKDISAWITEIVKTIIAILFVILFTNKRYEKFNSQLSKRNYISLTIQGILWLILIPIAIVLLTIISIGYLVGFSVVAFIIYFIIIYLSLQIVSISIASNIKNKKMPNKGNVEYVLVAILVMTGLWLLGKLPVLGIMAWLVIIAMALGIMMKYIFNNKEKSIENKEENIVEIKE